MNRHIVLLLLLLGYGVCPSSAQERLKPASGSFSEFSANYDHALREVLIGNDLPTLSVVVMPSFSKEYALTLRTENEHPPMRSILTYTTIDGKNSLWSAGKFYKDGKHSVPGIRAKSYETTLSERDARAVERLYMAAIQTMRMPDLDRRTIECDSTSSEYYISYDSYSGTCWSTSPGTNCGRLTTISEQLMEHARRERNELSDSLRNAIAALTHDFKSLRSAADFTFGKNIYNRGESGDDESQKIVELWFSNFFVKANISPDIPIEEVFGLPSAQEDGLREIARRLYLLEEVPYVVRIEVVSGTNPESAAILNDKDRYLPLMEMKLQPAHLDPDTFMRLYDRLAATPANEEYALGSEELRSLLQGAGSALKSN